MPTLEGLIQHVGRAEDPEINARRQHILGILLDHLKAREWTSGWIDGQLIEARFALRRVLAVRKLTPSDDETARIDACKDVQILQRWHHQAVDAASVSDALA